MQPDERDERLSIARSAYERREWRSAYENFVLANRPQELTADDLQRASLAADLTGNDDDCIMFLERAHLAYLADHEVVKAARCAFWLSLVWLLVKGEVSISAGWIARGQRTLEQTSAPSVESGYLKFPEGLHLLFGGQPAAALTIFESVTEVGSQYEDADLLAFARLGHGQCLVSLGDYAHGMQLLDEVMAGVTAGAVSTLPVGIIYCAVISCCQESFDIRRSREWTSAFGRWCDEQPDMVTFSGECLVHRAELSHMKGEWRTALTEAQHASRLLSTPGRSGAGNAFYEEGELHRLRGDLVAAETAYRRASERGRSPQPGLALLRLSQGRIEAATAAITRELTETGEGLARSRLLPAHIDIMIETGDLESAQASAEELRAIVARRDVPFLRAIATQGIGQVALARGDAEGALSNLRTAWSTWRDLGAPFEMAKVRVLISRACRLLGDEEGADLELAAAKGTFEQLGARADLELVVGLLAREVSSDSLLSKRELEVLRLITAGKTNRLIAADLVLSEKTVARHVSNILAKLGLPSRAAATAYAYEHHLV